MKPSKLALAMPAALLSALALLPPVWHLPCGLGAWAILRWSARDVHRTLGRPRRWLLGLASLCLLGAAFGQADTHVLAIPLSKAGALAGASMVVRAFAMVTLTSLVASTLPARRWLTRIRHPLARRLMEVVIVASNLVPVLVRSLATASTTLRERRPGLRRLPRRLWLLAVHASLRAAMLAESVAFDMAIEAHNARGDGKEPS